MKSYNSTTVIQQPDWNNGQRIEAGVNSSGILKARMLEWVAIPFSRGFSWPTDQIQVSCIAGRFLTIWATWVSAIDLGC